MKILLLFFIFIVGFSAPCHADLLEQNWSLIKEAFFQQRQITATDQMQVIAPLGAENAGQVPLTLKVKNKANDTIKVIYIFIDANPIPLAATYRIKQYFNQLTLATRVRLETDSTIRAVAETENGTLLMAMTKVNAGGGCAGVVAEDDEAVRASAGAVKFQLNPPYKPKEFASLTLQIKHPMYTGLQTDIKTKKIKPAFYIKHADIKVDKLSIMQIEFGVGTAENPYVNFNFDLPDGLIHQPIENMVVTTQDNEGKELISQFQL